MNVLLAEADVPYDQLKEMDEINPEFAQCDVAIVIGANDVVNPLPGTTRRSPIAGMPILNVDKARTVVVIKRSLSPGFAGIHNPLFAPTTPSCSSATRRPSSARWRRNWRTRTAADADQKRCRA